MKVNEAMRDTSKIPHGEPHAGKPHVAPSLCYGVTGRLDEGRAQDAAGKFHGWREETEGILESACAS